MLHPSASAGGYFISTPVDCNQTIDITNIDMLYWQYHHDQGCLRFRPTASPGLFYFRFRLLFSLIELQGVSSIVYALDIFIKSF